MAYFSLWHLVIFILFFVLPLWFFGKAVGKAGFSPWWVLFAVVPIVNIVMLWVFAYAKWPAFPDR